MNNNSEIAIIGMSCRFPGAKTIDEFWHNLRNGVESISFFSDRELVSSGVDAALLSHPNYVKANGVLSDIELFDASFFDFSAKEAQRMDPQHRLFLEQAWEALENAGYDAQTYDGSIGVYAGTDVSTYLLNNLEYNVLESQSFFQTLITNDKDYLPTRVSYKLNLKGPSVSVQTACSTSLVAVHLACQSLLNGECDMSLAGGVAIKVPQKVGYLYQEGMVASPDGHCRTFDARARGTIFGSGLGIVVLKRLADAIADRDCIHAVIKGSAINNDGSLKLSYTAPSIDSQTAVIAEAQFVAGVAPETITYIEAHGTATDLGDPIEVAALTQAFQTDKKGYCAIGSVKTNFGHLGAAAGVAGLIKTVLALKHQLIPPSLHFEQPNPKIDFANSPFYVNTKLSEWQTDKIPRRAGVSSFGIGGTNAHVVLEEAPPVQSPLASSGPWQLLVLSAKTNSALETATANLTEYLKHNSKLNLADVAHTLQVGRRGFEHRRMLVCQNLDDAVKALESLEPQRVFTHSHKPRHRPVVFMFSGQGAQYANMARELYEVEPTFREQIDICSDILKPHLGLDLRHILYPSEEQVQEVSQQIKQTAIAQPALFAIEYALAKLWMKWGVNPVAAIGHSIGEYVAATLAGVFSLEDALALVATRGQLMQQMPPGTMLAVPLPAEEVQPLLGKTLSLAAINTPSSCVVSGATDALELLQSQLASQGVNCRRLHTSHAFHSQMMEPILEPFTLAVKQISLKPPQFPYISNVSGTWITPEEATDPDYWASHLRQTVRFASGLQELFKEPAQILLEVGPGRTLSQLAKQHPDKHPEQVVLTSVRHPQESQSNVAFLLNALGRLWLSGVEVNWKQFSQCHCPQRIPLPSYPFDRQRYWIEPQKQQGQFLTAPTQPDLWQSLVEAGQSQAIQGIPEFDEQTYLENKQWLDLLCIAYLNQTLRNLGAFSNLDRKYSFDQLLEQCRIIPRYRQLLSRWLQVLVEQGNLQQDGEFFTNIKPLSADSINALAKEVRHRWGDTPGLVDLVQRCGENLVAILVGEKEPLEFFNTLIYQKENSSNRDLPLFGYCTSILQKSLEQVVKSLPSTVNLRILEIGAGMGITTANLLPLLPPEQTNYTFTDIGGWFLKQAKHKFGDYPFIEYRLLNIDNPPQEQGFESHSFDIIVASNVLHVTRNIGETLKYVRSLLAPEGFLLLWETTQPQLDFDISWGLLMNSIDDGERSQGNPFLSAAQWQEALRDRGFVEVAVFPETEALGHQIIVAQASLSAELLRPTAFSATCTSKNADQILPVSSDRKTDIAEWFYIPSWKRSLPPKPLAATEPGCWLVFVDECGLGTKLVKQLELEGHDVVIVRAGEQFSSESQFGTDQRLYTINPQQLDQYDALLKELCDRNLTPKAIAHLWSVTPNDGATSGLEGVDLVQEKGLYSLLFLAQALGKQNFTEELQIAVISNNMQAVTGDELLCPAKATLLGAVRVIPLEYPNIRCCNIDVVLPPTASWQEEKLVNQLLAELKTPFSDSVIAYRGAHRWVQTFEPVRLDQAVEETPRLREEGVYLITGGLGAIGLTLASHLAKTVRAKLVLTGRSPFPTREDWSKWLRLRGEDDDISRKIRKVQQIEALGAEVLIVSADVSNLEQMRRAIAQVRERFGQLNGVIHAAGILGDSAIARKTALQVESVLAPKVKGALVLDALLNDVELDFLVLCSSGAAIQPLFGQVAYAGANNFLDVFAHYKTSTDGTFAVSINWEGWQESGMGIEGTKRLALALGRTMSQPESKPVLHPLFDRYLVDGNEQEIYISNLSDRKHWVLDEHRLAGKATLPGTAYLELIRAACENHAQNKTIEIRQAYFLTPLVVEDGEEKEVRTILKKRGDRFEFAIVSQLNFESDSWQEHAIGEVAFIEAQPQEKHELQAIKSSCNWQELIITEQDLKLQTSFVEYGSRWNAISKQVKLSNEQGLILLEMPEVFATDLNFYKLHPALLDVATGFLTVQYEGTYLPFCYKNLRIKGCLSSQVYSHIKAIENNQSQNETLKFNITVMDEQGITLIEIEEYTLRKIERGKADVNIAKQSGSRHEKTPAIPDSQNFYLSISSPGILDTLTFQPTTRQKPEAGEVEIEVSTTGLNFKEVLIALGLIPIYTDSAYKFGFECAGKIVALGEGVEDFEIGDEVIAFAPSCFSRFTTTSAQLVAPKPTNLSLEEAVTIPVAFTTAYTALIHFGRLCRGEKILIHAAAGGVGLAAIQIAQWVGAEILVTAGSPEKREFLRSLGIKCVMDSRSLAFADEVMKHTNGKGVDVVLNSLGGEFIPKSLSVLAPYGRFLELGQRDIFNNSQLGLKAFEKHLSFFAIQADPKLRQFNFLWHEVVQHFKEGNFKPLPHQVFPVQSVAKAFECMAGAKHIGKVVVSMDVKEVFKALAVSEEEVSWKAIESSFSSLPNPATPTNKIQTDFRQNWLLPSEGIEVFNRILGNTLPQVLVSTVDLVTRKELILQSEIVAKPLEKTNRTGATIPKIKPSNPHAASRNEIEQILIYIWQEMLGSKQLGVRDNFFELGGDSLIAVQVMSQVREMFQIDLPASSLFDNPTITGMAEKIERIRRTAEKLQASTDDQSNDREEIAI